MPPRVTDVKALPGHRLRIAFSTGEIKEYDVTPWLDKGVFTGLRDEAVFGEAYVDLDTVCWPGGLDISPGVLYDGGTLVERR